MAERGFGLSLPDSKTLAHSSDVESRTPAGPHEGGQDPLARRSWKGTCLRLPLLKFQPAGKTVPSTSPTRSSSNGATTGKPVRTTGAELAEALTLSEPGTPSIRVGLTFLISSCHSQATLDYELDRDGSCSVQCPNSPGQGLQPGRHQEPAVQAGGGRRVGLHWESGPAAAPLLTWASSRCSGFFILLFKTWGEKSSPFPRIWCMK